MAMNAQPPPRTSLQGARFAVRFVDLGQKVGGAFVVLSADLRHAHSALVRFKSRAPNRSSSS